jgi:aminopeptidase N
MVIGIAAFAVEHLGEVEGVPVQTWVYPEDRGPGFHDFAVALPMMEWFTDRIGEYPYAKLANVESTTRYGGMENASSIFYAEQGVTGRRRNEATVAHEIAHQWFGNSATEGDWHHIWLSEGFATYFTNLYWESAYGREAMEARLKAQRTSVLNYYSARPDAPVVDVRITDPNELLSANSYQKGGWVLHLLRSEIGTEAFWQGIREYYSRFRDGNAVTEDLRDVMEEVSGVDLDWFFEQWIYRAGQPALTGDWSYDPDSGMLTVKLEQTQDDPFVFKLEIRVRTADGESFVEEVRVDSKSTEFTVETSRPVGQVELDPNVNLLFINDFGSSR